MARITIHHRYVLSPRWRTPPVLALIAALMLLSGTRAFDCLRAASYFVRTRRGPAVSIVRLDQESQFARPSPYVVVRKRPHQTF
jgi:hypothetical protein